MIAARRRELVDRYGWHYVGGLISSAIQCILKVLIYCCALTKVTCNERRPT